MIEWYLRWKFTFLFGTMVGLLVVQALFEDAAFHQQLFSVLYSFVLIATVIGFAREPRLRWFLVILGVLALSGTWSVSSLGTDAARELILADRVLAVVFLGVTAVLVIRRVILETRVTIDTLMGSVCAYLLIAATFGMSFSAIEVGKPGSFLMKGSPMDSDFDQTANINEWIYYSFMTLTTLGYGSVMPASRIAGTLTWIEAMTGQFYLAVLVARLVGLHTVPNIAPSPDDEQ
ncbi:MAG: ion channel [Planctomycetota bacterium]